jgi:NADP-dependent 3-hydroxy acid dehydrogenase YdfG
MGVDLGGRRVLVTGASSGIGAEVCRAVVRSGGSVAMMARRQERLDGLHDELGDRAVPIPCDVTDLDALEVAVADAASGLGGLDGVVTVAGKMMVGSITTGTPRLWRDLFELNLLAPLATVRFAADHFAAGVRRDVVLVGSAAALTALPGTAIYSASKRGLQAAFDTLRLELATEGINVSHVMPGMFETEGLTLEGLVIDGEVPANDFPFFAGEATPADPAVLADIIAFVMSLPDGVSINELVVRPTRQYNP